MNRQIISPRAFALLGFLIILTLLYVANAQAAECPKCSPAVQSILEPIGCDTPAPPGFLDPVSCGTIADVVLNYAFRQGVYCANPNVWVDDISTLVRINCMSGSYGMRLVPGRHGFEASLFTKIKSRDFWLVWVDSARTDTCAALHARYIAGFCVNY
jgi:hypothetical protein